MSEGKGVSSFGSVLHAERKRLGLTQVELAQRLDSTQQAVGGWEAGKTAPTEKFYARMMEVFGRSSPLKNFVRRGEVVTATNAIHSARESSRAQVFGGYSAFATKLAALFDSLPEDELVRAQVFSQCVGILSQVLSPAPTPASSEGSQQVLLPAPRRT